MPPTKIDFKKTLKHLYSPTSKDFALIDVPEMTFMMIDGQGDPNTSADYKDVISALYSLAYTLKFKSKRELEIDYTVPPLEGLWWAAEMEGAFDVGADREAWLWTMMMLVPDHVPAAMIEAGREEAARKKELPALPRLRVEPYHEGLSVQIMHIGPYSAEGPTLSRLHHEYMPAHGLTFNGKHHEIYIGDPTRTAPERLKTVLRQPVKRV
jgi:hypothetical protein